MTAEETCPACGANFSRASAALGQQLRLPRDPAPAGRRAGRLEKFCWWGTIIGSLIGLVQMLITAFSATSAPQQAAGAAMAVMTAAVPYCLARAVQMLSLRDP
ncbi:hypothetical protein [Dokdonella soli]